MLLPYRPETPKALIFNCLNEEVRNFFISSIGAKRFTAALFTENVGSIIWENGPTKEHFKAVWDELKPLSEADRRRISGEIEGAQNVGQHLTDKTSPPPNIPAKVSSALRALTTHLFSRTAKLVGLDIHCGQTIQAHFNQFVALNKMVCLVCGSENLTQLRMGVDADDQWRGPYDHLLAKEKYPIYGIHPGNLFPICHTCNSKAKLSKDLLIGDGGIRRLSFYPFTESAFTSASVYMEADDSGLKVKAVIADPNPVTQEKLDTWNSIYQISARVEGEFTKLTEIVDTDCRSESYDQFKRQIEIKSDSYRENCRVSAWAFWKYKLYMWLRDQGEELIQTLWATINSKRDDANHLAEFGI